MRGDDDGAGGTSTPWRCAWCHGEVAPEQAVTCPHDLARMHRICAQARERCGDCMRPLDVDEAPYTIVPFFWPFVLGHLGVALALVLAAVGGFLRDRDLAAFVCLVLAAGVVRLLTWHLEGWPSLVRLELLQESNRMQREAAPPLPTARREGEVVSPAPADEPEPEAAEDPDAAEDPAESPPDLVREVAALQAAGLLELVLQPVRIGEGAPFQPGGEVSVREAILEVPGIGTATVGRLRAAGIETVADLLARGARVPGVPVSRATALERWAARRARRG